MWFIVAREPYPDLADWPGRQWLAVLDAFAWPVFWCGVLSKVPLRTGIVGPMTVSLAVLFALRRLHRAVFLNHRYRFTTWRWAKVAGGLIVIGLVMKLATIWIA